MFLALHAGINATAAVRPNRNPIIVGIIPESPPYSFLDEEGNPAGYDVDLTRALAGAMNLQVEIRTGPWEEIRSDLETGRIDAIAGMYFSQKRDELVDFTSPYTISHHSIFVRPDAPPIESEQDLLGKEIIVINGDIMHEHLQASGLSRSPVLAESHEDAIKMLVSGRYDCAVLSRLQALYWISEMGVSGIEITGPLLNPSQACYAVREGDIELRQHINEALSTLGQTGELKRIYDEWLGVLEPRGIPSGTVYKYLGAAGLLVVFLVVLFAVLSYLLRKQVAVRTEALQESEERFRSIIETSRDWIWAIDTEGRDTFSSPAITEILGYAPEEMLGHPHVELLHPEDREFVENQFERWLEERKGWKNLVLRWRDRNGGFRYLESNAVAVFDGEGNITGLRGVDRDVTERKNAENALQASEKRFRELAEMLPEAVFETDTALKMTFANRRAFELFGYAGEDLDKGVDGLDLIAPRDRERVATYVAMRSKGNDSGTVEYEALRKDGGTFPVLLHAIPIEKDGEITGFRGIVVDITEQKKEQREKAELEEHFQQSQKVESLGRLAGGVAHDLNNLLTPILGFGEILMAGFDLHDPQRGQMNEIMKAGTRARDLVKQLLAFGRKQTLDSQTVDLNKVILGFEKLLRRTIREDIEIRIATSEETCSIEADVGQLEQVLLNLAINAQDAMPTGGRLEFKVSRSVLDEAFVKKHQGAKPGVFALLEVSDTGCGIDQNTLRHLFEPFYSTKGQKGTGLGLATVYGIVKQHDGNIWVASEPGKGTTFSVYLPTTDKVPHENRIGDTSLNSPDVEGGTEKILLVEDNEPVRNMVRMTLLQQGYQVFAAADGSEALAVLDSRKGGFDLLLTDVVMPEMNGRDLYSRVAEILPEIRVLYMSGYTDDVIVHHGVLDAGINFIQKPFTGQDLSQKVREVLDSADS